MSFNFNELNLSDADVSSGGNYLKPGKYVVKVSDVKIAPSKKNDGSMVMALKISDVNSGGSLNHWINILVKSSVQATEIGRSELKTLLFYGGHPNPDKPGDVSLINGLTVGVVIGESKYTDKRTGEEKTGSEVKAFIDPSEIDPSRFSPKALPEKKQGDGFSDEIPF